jgi:hypothetical protein
MKHAKSGKSVPTKPPTPRGPNVLEIGGDPIEAGQLVANLAAEGLCTNAVLMRNFSTSITGEIGITEAMNALRESVASVSKGDQSPYETMLLGQAAALNAIFAELARRASLNMGEYMDATDRYMRLALKAQGQCRATLETLAAIKNPPLVYARQANINNGGQQQVNNGAIAEAVRAGADAGGTASQPNKLLEASDGERLDDGAQGAAGNAHQDLAPVGALHRAEDRGR